MMRVLVALAVVTCTGCATYTLVEPRKTSIGDAYTVDPQIQWSAISLEKMDVWTVDGAGLDAIRFVKGLKDGDELLKVRGPNKAPTFRSTMTPTEIMEFVVDSMIASGVQKAEGKGLRPTAFGQADGFRFEMPFVNRNGLENESTVIGATIKGRLYLILYSGVRIHYYPKYLGNVERLLQSVTLQ